MTVTENTEILSFLLLRRLPGLNAELKSRWLHLTVKTVELLLLNRIGRSFLLDIVLFIVKGLGVLLSLCRPKPKQRNLSQNIYTRLSSNIPLSFHSANVCDVLV